MGASPSITFTLVHATPYRLRYLMVGDGNETPAILPNAGGATPDLRTDAATASYGNARTPILEVVSQAVPAGAGAASLGALFSQRVTQLVGTALPRLACETKVVRRVDAALTPLPWRCDAQEGNFAGDPASAGFPVLVVTPSGNAGEAAYLDIKVAHSETDGFPNPPNSDGP